LRRLGRSESGAEVIEFALTLPLLLLVVLGIIEFGFVFQQYEVVTNAAREGARIASLTTYGPDNDSRKGNAKARVEQYLTAGGLTVADANVCVGPPEATDSTDGDDVCDGTTALSAPLPLPGIGGTPICVTTIRVKVRYNHPVAFVGGIFSYFGGSFGDLTLRARSTMRTEAASGRCPPSS
jgi:Flp pilus assembly protein TadG